MDTVNIPPLNCSSARLMSLYVVNYKTVINDSSPDTLRPKIKHFNVHHKQKKIKAIYNNCPRKKKAK